MLLRSSIETQARQAHVPFDNFDLFVQECAELPAVALVERIEGRRFLHDLLEAPLRRRYAVAANQQSDLADVGNIFEQINEPHFADESGHANQQKVPLREILANREAFDSRRFAK